MLNIGVYLGVLFIITVSGVSTGPVRDDVTEGTELLFSFVLHRHGDRTPIENSLAFSDDPETLAAYSAPYGYGQLTEAGYRTGYRVGEFIRRRYNELLSPKYNRSDIYVRSTDSTRTKMTALTSLAAVYPLVGTRWNPKLDWTPVPYTTVPAKYDFNAGFLNCPKYMEFLNEAMTLIPPELEEYTEVLDKLTQILNIDFSLTPLAYATALYSVCENEISLGIRLSSAIREILPQIEEIAALGWSYTYGDLDHLRYVSGVLLNEFFTYANLIISGEETPRVRVYSAHDANVFPTVLIYNIPTQGIVKYGGTISLELRKVTATGKYVILPVYLRDPREPEEYLQVTGCDLLCDIDQFYALTSHNALNETEWRSECGFTDDLEIDASGIN